MPTATLNRRVGTVVGYSPLCDMTDLKRGEFHEALLDADELEEPPGKWQSAILKVEQSRPEDHGVQAALPPDDRPARAQHVREISLLPPARDALLTLPERQAYVFRAGRGCG